MRARALLLGMLLGTLGVGVGWSAPAEFGSPSPRPGLLGDPNVFPIGVWLQNPRHAARYRAAGFNLYIGLWKGPTSAQLQQLKAAQMAVVCHQNELGLTHRDDPTIVGWMQQDEPDNAQSLGRGKGYGPPVTPAEVRTRYEQMRAADPCRPVLLNLGQGVAWDQWHGRGVRTNCPEDYPLYVQACDTVSFDIYPACHAHPDVAGRLWYVARGVERLVGWTQGAKPVWNCIECTRINHPERKATPHQVRCEVWMSIVHGSTGLIYFVHEWQPRFDEAALLSDPEMLAAVTRLNHRIQTLAPVLNGPTISGGVTVESRPADIPVAVMMKRAGAVTYVFAVAMRDAAAQARFTVSGLTGATQIDVLDEDRTLTAQDGVFRDTFEAWDVHLYAIGGRATQ
ncbi:MAG: hypothetical protein JSW27_08955 [Phycisphaerales bacterium]|nr:MAG: hypothetical protein JSW27_08955 [Phycisphaerales bacterium]